MKPTKRNTVRKTRTPPASRTPVEPSGESSDKLVVVFTSNGPLAAEVAKSKLESAGIQAMLSSEAQSAFALTVDGMGEVKVLVRAEDEARAMRLLKQQTSRRF